MTSSLHQLAIGLRITEKTLLAWNKKFNIKPSIDEQGQLIYSPEQKDLILRLHYLIKERGFTLAGAQKELKKPDIRVQRETTIQRLLEIRGFLQNLKESLQDDEA